MPVALILLRKVRGHLCQCLVGSQSDADRHTHISLNLLVQVLTPLLQVQMIHTVKIDEALIDGISEIGRNLLGDKAYDTTCQFSIEFIVRGEHCNLCVGKLLSQLIVWCSSLNS